jgi:hypothetical protein
MDIMNYSPQETVQVAVSSNKSEEKEDNANVNLKNQLNDKISKLQAMILNFVTEN